MGKEHRFGVLEGRCPRGTPAEPCPGRCCARRRAAGASCDGPSSPSREAQDSPSREAQLAPGRPPRRNLEHCRRLRGEDRLHGHGIVREGGGGPAGRASRTQMDRKRGLITQYWINYVRSIVGLLHRHQMLSSHSTRFPRACPARPPTQARPEPRVSGYSPRGVVPSPKPKLLLRRRFFPLAAFGVSSASASASESLLLLLLLLNLVSCNTKQSLSNVSLGIELRWGLRVSSPCSAAAG